MKNIKTDCRFLRGHVPCTPNKQYGVTCVDCKYYRKFESLILIIKLGAAGDVIRTTPLLFPLKKEYPDSKIIWLTYSPELVPVKGEVCADEVLNFTLQNIIFLQQTEFDVVINLDKDKEAIGLMSSLNANKKFGFTLIDGLCSPVNKLAEHKFLTGLFDNVSKENKKHYIEEIFEICGYGFKGEKYILELNPELTDKKWVFKDGKRVVGLNTGCGDRWVSRLWADKNWIELINKLTENNFEVVLLGGKQEDEKNAHFASKTKAKYFGHYDLKTFTNLVNKCDIVVSQVTMAMHIAIGLGKKLVLMNNIFNPNEFELYGNSEIIQPRKECKCYFSTKCTNTEYKCMDHMMPKDIFNSVVKLSGA